MNLCMSLKIQVEIKVASDKNIKEYELDHILGKQIMTHLQEFFNKPSKNKTQRNIIKKNKTRRKYY